MLVDGGTLLTALLLYSSTASSPTVGGGWADGWEGV